MKTSSQQSSLTYNENRECGNILEAHHCAYIHPITQDELALVIMSVSRVYFE